MNKATKMIQYVLTKSALASVLNQYFGLVINNGTFGLDEISSRMQDGRPAVEDADVRLVARALADTVVQEVVVNHNKVDLGPIQVELAIDGSVPSLNSPLTEENTIYVAIYVADYLRREIEKIIPSRSTSDKVAVKLENVEDLTTHKKLVRGLGEFVITGSGLSAKREGESLKLCTLDGEEVTAVTVLEREGMGERIYAKLQSAVPGGTYLLQLLSRGYYTPDAEPQMYSRKVPVEAVESPEPEVTDVASEGHEGEIVIGTPFAAIGSGLDAFDPETGSVKVKWSQGGVEKDAEIEPAEVTATKMSFAYPDALVGVPADTVVTFEITFDETVKAKGSKLVEE